MSAALLSTHCPTLNLIARGKVRDIYEVPGHNEGLLFVSTDRVSAFDVIMKNGIPDKGKLLTALSLFFFEYLSKAPETKDIPNHIITADIDKMPEPVRQYRDQLTGRIMWVRRVSILPVEAIVRGYITGSAWVEYKKSQTVHGLSVGEGLLESSEFVPPLFTPSTKAEVGGHDENIHPDKLKDILKDEWLAGQVASYALRLYTTAAKYSKSRGLILADTKFEFGLSADGSLVFADECLTPDSSRFWPASQYAPGKTMVGFDKQFLREWLKSPESGFNNKDGIEIPNEIIGQTWAKYEEAFEMITGKKFVA